MRRGIITSWCWAVLFTMAQGQSDPKSLGLGRMRGVALDHRMIGGMNPALSAADSSSGVRLTMLPSPFGLRELRTLGFSGWTGNPQFAVTGEIVHKGVELYSLTHAELSARGEFAQSVSLGAGLSCEAWKFPGYEGTTEWRGLLGSRVGGDGYHMGVTAELLLKSEDTGARHALVVAGVSVNVLDWLDAAVEVEQTDKDPMEVRYGIVVSISGSVSVSGGWNNDPEVVGACVSTRFKSFIVDLGADWHTVLGWTVGYGITVLLD